MKIWKIILIGGGGGGGALPPKSQIICIFDSAPQLPKIQSWFP